MQSNGRESEIDGRMNATHISFYLKNYRIHLFVDTLRGIGSPRFIQFLVDQEGASLAVMPAGKKGFKAHRVPHGIYEGLRKMEVNSYGLCKLIANKYGWDPNCSYRVPGVVSPEQKAAVFDLSKAAMIGAEKHEHKSVAPTIIECERSIPT